MLADELLAHVVEVPTNPSLYINSFWIRNNSVLYCSVGDLKLKFIRRSRLIGKSDKMEDDTAANYTDTEKLTKFSVSLALRQLLDRGPTSPDIAKLKSYLNAPKWSPLMVERCLEDIARLLLFEKSGFINDITQIFAPILIELVQRASCIQLSSELKHQLMCILFGKLITRNKAILQ